MKRRYLPFALTPAISLILLLHANYLRFVCDDAFISFRYAKNFIQGHGLVYNIGEKVEGYTNFLWTLLLSLFMKVGFDPVLISQVLGVVFGLGTVIVLLRFNKKLYPEENFFNYLAPLFLASCGAFAAWCTGGLETSLYTFLAFLGAVFSVRGLNQPRYLAFSGLSFGLACMTRLDGLVFASFTFVFLFQVLGVNKGTRLRQLSVWTASFLLPFLMFFLWRWQYYGKLLPNTFYVKTGGASLLDPGLLYLSDFVRRFWIWLLAIPLLLLGRITEPDPVRKIVIFYFASLTLVYSLYVVMVGGDFMDMFRFLIPILPYLSFLLQEGFRGIYQRIQALRNGRGSLAAVSSQVVLVVLSLFLLVSPSSQSNKVWSKGGIDSIGLLRTYTHEWSKVGQTFKSMAEPGESLSTTAAGAIPYYSEMYAIDELGLTLQGYSFLKSREALRPGHEKRVTVDYLLFRRPTYIIGHPLIEPTPQSADTLTFEGRDEALMLGGYRPLFVPIRMSGSEVRYLYCLSLKDSALEKAGLTETSNNCTHKEQMTRVSE